MTSDLLYRQLLTLSPQERAAISAENLRQLTEAKKGRRLYEIFPDTGPLRRQLYPKHMEFFAAGAEANERAFIAGNRIGKTMGVAFEATCHMTGWYPHWWVGRRFDRPTVGWIAGEDTKTMRESIEPTYLGPPDARRSGMVPADNLVEMVSSRGVPDAIDSFTVRHKTGGTSRAVFKTYEQGRESFQSAAVDWIHMDEEPPLPIYTEALTRTMSTVPGTPNGIVMCSFTPLKGLSQVVLLYLPGGALPNVG